jgi:hypothetical protein
MRTFEELAQAALSQEPTHMVVKELAEAMHRLEYNLAVQMAFARVPRPIEADVQKILIQTWLGNLRADLPDG